MDVEQTRSGTSNRPHSRKGRCAGRLGGPAAPGRTHYRRKWKPAPPQRRLAAAEAMGDLFGRRRGARLVLAGLLLGSLGAHALLVSLNVVGNPSDSSALQANEDSYLGKVLQKQRAKGISKKLANRITMPPPPPDPEAVVSRTLTSEIGSDINKTIGKMLDVKVTGQLAAKVQQDLKAELAEAAKDIAEGKLSEDEIKALQDEFKRKAHERTVAALQDYREETQVENATQTMTDWYEGRVGATLVNRLQFEVYRANGRVWGAWDDGNWGFLHAGHIENKLRELGSLIKGQHHDDQVGGKPLEHGWRLLPDWPASSQKQAEAMEALARGIYDRHPRGWAPSWAEAVESCVNSYHPHRRDELTPGSLKKIDQLWEQLWKELAEYKAKASADPGAGPTSAIAAAQQACLATMEQLHKEASALTLPPERANQCGAINQAVRSRVLRGEDVDVVYKRLIDRLVDGFTPAIRDLAETGFREGLLIRQKGQEDSLKEFSTTVLALLRRDVERAIPRPRFGSDVFASGSNPYVSQVTGERGEPTPQDIERDEDALGKALAAWGQGQAYTQRRTQILQQNFAAAADRIAQLALERMTEDGRLRKDFYASVETVDYTDKVQLRLEARKRAMDGRKQDLARLTEDGVPDTSAPMIALLFGASKGHGANLEPMPTIMQPAFLTSAERPESALRAMLPLRPAPPISWGRVTQSMPEAPFASINSEAIPFLANFPRLDGDLTDWGKIRPLTLRDRYKNRTENPTLLYAAWNYQGFFFGYRVEQKPEKYCYPSVPEGDEFKGVLGAAPRPSNKYGNRAWMWAEMGDHFRLCFDTLDSRMEARGDPHTQEFIILPRGTENAPDLPGIERLYESKRDAFTMVGMHGWEGPKVTLRIFPNQASPEDGPDGTGPYRACRFDKDGYTMEVFVPRTLFTMPVFAPGWYIGFDALVGVGYQHSGDWRGHMFQGQQWAGPRARYDRPNSWGDLLMLGTDPQLAVQEADEAGTLADAIVPGRSYLVTVVDPDRNVNLAAEDTVLVSAEVGDPNRDESRLGYPAGGQNDVEVFILKETGKNSSVFRGYVNTQPGIGRQVQGALECLPGQQVAFGYVDFANAKGDRNPIYHLKLPVIAPLTLSESGR